MSFKSIDHVLGQLDDRYRTHGQHQSQRLIRAWVEAVGPVVAVQTRPLSIFNDVLRVATSSSAWSQNLVFERQRILTKLNALLASSLVDIRFSSAQWQESPRATFSADLQAQLWQQHPSRVANTVRSFGMQRPETLTDPLLAFQHWRALVRSRSESMPCCPQCQCPSPPGELQRWAMCSLCVAKQW